MEKQVAIILVNYNGALDTLECIESINRMSYKDFHIIVVDNSSTDDSLKILTQKKEEFAFELIDLPENLGFSAGNNSGIQKAIEIGVQYILLLNNDTIVDPDFLSNLMREAECNVDTSVVTGTIYYASNRNKLWYAAGEFNPHLAKVTQIDRKCKNGKLPKKSIDVTFASGCCLCVPVSIIKRIGLLDESYFMYEEDVDYCHRLIQNNFKIRYVPDAILYHKVSSSTTKTKKISAITQYYMVRNKFVFINRYYNGLNSIIPYLHSLLMYSYYCIRYGMKPRYVAWAIFDFLRGKSYISERKL
jgi:GT2 family glycosyltransferase